MVVTIIPSSPDEMDWCTVEKHLKKIAPEMEAINKRMDRFHRQYAEHIAFDKIKQKSGGYRLDIVMENITKAMLVLIDIINLWDKVLKLHSVEAITSGFGPEDAGSSPVGAIHFTKKIKEGSIPFVKDIKITGDVAKSGKAPD